MFVASLWQIALLLCASVHVSGSITFIEQPGDTNATEGNMVPCYCTYTGTIDLPLWKINETTYAPNLLPPAFSVNSSGLFFVARLEFSYTTFQCFFSIYTSSGQFQKVESRIGTVLVADDPEYDPPDVRISPCTEDPAFVGVLIDSNCLQIYWKANCTNSTKVKYTYAMCNDSENIIDENFALQPLNYKIQLESIPLFQLIMINSSYITKLTINGSLLEEQTDAVLAISSAKIPFRCGSGQFCIFSNLSDVTCINKNEFRDSENFPPGYHACGDLGDLHICIENIAKEMNETLYTVMCHQDCCTDVNSCLNVTGSSKLIIGRPPLQPGTPCLFFNTTHVAICLEIPFSHFRIDKFMLNTDLCGSYNLTLEELCKPFPFWSNCTPTEFNVVAYSAAGASVPSAAVFVNAIYSEDSEKRFEFFCKCVAALIPSVNLRLEISPQDSSILIVEVTTPDSLPPAVRLDLCSNNANISIIAEEQRECREMYDWNGTCSDTGTTSIGRVKFNVPERCSNEDRNYTLVASVPLVINGATEIPCYFLETNLSVLYGNIDPISDETDSSIRTKVSIGIGGTIGGILVILVPIVIGCIWCIRRYKQERREYRLEEEENRHRVTSLDDPVAEGPHKDSAVGSD